MAQKISTLELKRRICLAAIRDGKTITIRFPRGKGLSKYAEENSEEWEMDPRELRGDMVYGFLLPGPSGREEERGVNIAHASFISFR